MTRLLERLYIMFFIVGLIAMSSSVISCQNNQYNQGEKIYNAVCANCHMENGAGLGTMFPPIATSDYIAQNWDKIACIIKNGMKGKIIVNGVEYNEVMPPNPKISDAEMTNLLNYIKSEWYEKNQAISIKTVSKQLSECDNK